MARPPCSHGVKLKLIMATHKSKPELTGSPAEWMETALAIDDIDSSEYARIVSELQNRGDRATLDSMLRLSRGDLPARRLALNVLGRFGEPAWPFREEIVARLLEMWRENAGDEASDLVAALSHHCEFLPVREILLSLVHHPDFWVRWYLTHAFGDDKNHESTSALIQLSRDSDEVIRDWATFALGNSEYYSPAVRAALSARLDDEDFITRLEAIHGLVEHGEIIVLDAIINACESNEEGETLWDKSGDDSPEYRVLPALYQMKDNGSWNADVSEKLRAATAACEKLVA